MIPRNMSYIITRWLGVIIFRICKLWRDRNEEERVGSDTKILLPLETMHMVVQLLSLLDQEECTEKVLHGGSPSHLS